MSVPLPNLTPSARTYVPPRWPTTSSRSQSGVNSLRIWGSQPTQATLNMTFVNIPDASAAAFATAHRDARGPIVDVTLGATTLAGLGTALAAELAALQTTHGLRWYFPENDPPRISSVKPGVSNVEVNLVAELRMV